MLGRSAPLALCFSGLHPVETQGQRWGPWPQRTLAPLDHGEGTHRRHVHWHPWHWHTGTRTGMSSPLACTRRPWSAGDLARRPLPLRGRHATAACYRSSSHSRVAPTFTLHSSHIKHTLVLAVPTWPCRPGARPPPGHTTVCYCAYSNIICAVVHCF